MEDEDEQQIVSVLPSMRLFGQIGVKETIDKVLGINQAVSAGRLSGIDKLPSTIGFSQAFGGTGVSALGTLGPRAASYGLVQAFSTSAIDADGRSAFRTALGLSGDSAAGSIASGYLNSIAASGVNAGVTSKVGLSFAQLTGATTVGLATPLSAYTSSLGASLQSGISSQLDEQYRELSIGLGGKSVPTLQDALKVRLPGVDIALPDVDALSNLADMLDELDIDDGDFAEFEAQFADDGSLSAALDEVVPQITKQSGLSRHRARKASAAFVLILVSGGIFVFATLAPEALSPVVAMLMNFLGATGLSAQTASQQAGKLFDRIWPEDDEAKRVDRKEPGE